MVINLDSGLECALDPLCRFFLLEVPLLDLRLLTCTKPWQPKKELHKRVLMDI